jgi:CubicO group peptidase (beta-lactamase class C family)
MKLPIFAAMVTLGSCIALADAVTGKPEDVGLSSERLARIAALMQAHIAAHDISGAVTLVARRGKVVHLQAHGLADLESKRPMRTDTLFRMFSMTKPLTAVSVLMLMEEGKLLLSDPVSRYIPEFRDQKVAVVRPPNDPLPAGAGVALVSVDRPVTLKDLLTHTAGMADSPEPGPATEYVRRANLPTTGTLAERVQREGAIPLNFQPGSHWQYSGTFGFDALARIVEIQSGMTLDQFFRTRIFEPLGMHDAFFQVPSEHAANMALPYAKSNKGLTSGAGGPPSSVSYFSGAGGSGGIAATAADYARFCQMLLNGGQLDGKRLLSRKSVELMTSDAIPGMDLRNYRNGEQVLQGYGFGLGVRIRRDNGENGWLGSPGDYGWAGALGTYFWIDPREEMIGIMLIETPIIPLRMEFPNAVYQAVID